MTTELDTNSFLLENHDTSALDAGETNPKSCLSATVKVNATSNNGNMISCDNPIDACRNQQNENSTDNQQCLNRVDHLNVDGSDTNVATNNEEQVLLNQNIETTTENNVENVTFINQNLPDICENEEPEIPDGGWGWLIVAASFAVHIIADGIVYSFGVFFVEFLTHFGGTHAATSWLGSLVPGVTLTSGPIASALTNRYGCRPVTIAGSLIASAGFILSIFAPNIGYLYFTFGILSGFGFGLIYLPAIVSVTQYFEKRRAFATGLAVCGSGIGTFVFAPLSNWLIETFHWKGAILIQAGIILNCVISGALFRPLRPKCKQKDEELQNYDDAEMKSLVISDFELTELPNGNAGLRNNVNVSKLSRSVDVVNRSRRNTESTDNESYAPLSHSTLNVPHLSNYHKQQRRHSSHASLGNTVLRRRDIFYSGSLYNIPQYKSNPRIYRASIVSVNDTISPRKTKFLCFNCSPQISLVFKEMLDVSLLKHPIFMLFAISNFFTSIGFNMPFIYLPDRALHVGIDPQRAAFLVSVIGIANTIGRIVFGYLADRSWVKRIWLYNTALIFCGLGTAFSPFANTFATLIIYACIFGMFIGVYVSLTSVVLVDLLGLDKLTNSFGLLLMFQGVATFIGPPIAGWLFDITGSYDISFIVEGLLIAFSGLILFAIPCVQRFSKKADSDCKDTRPGRSLHKTQRTIVTCDT